MSALSKIILATAAILTLLIVTTHAAHAEIPGDLLDGLTDTDAAAGLFSGLTGDIATGGTALMRLVSLSSYLAMIVASIVLIYLIAVGIINTARHGEFLGKSWNGSWTFLRPAVALALIIPLPTASGLSFAQAAMIELPKFSVSVASAAWRWTIDNVAVTPIARVPVPNDLSVASSVLLAQVCTSVASFNAIDPANASSTPAIDRMRDGDGVRVTVSYGSQGRCGVATWVTDGASAQAALDAFSRLHNDLAPIARNIFNRDLREYDGYGVALNNAIIGASQRFHDAISGAAYAAAQSRHALSSAENTDDLKAAGWVGAGGYYYMLAQQQGAVAAASRGAIPALTLPDGGVPDGSRWDNELYAQAAAETHKAIMSATQAMKRNDAIVASGDSMMVSLVEPVFSAIREIIDSDGPPILRIKLVGDTLSDAAEALVAAATGAAATKAAVGWAPFVGRSITAVADAVQSTAGYLIPLFASLGFAFSTAIPSLPYIMWIVGVAGFLLLVIEAIIAVPLALVMMAHPDGDDLLGRAEPIIGRLIEVFLRPLLMIVALVAGIAIFSLVVDVLDATYWRMMSGRLEGGQSLLGYIGALVGYLVILTMLAMLSFSQVLSLPGKILEWLGSWSGRSGDLGEGEAQHTAGHAGAAAGRGVADAARTTTSGASAMAGGVGKKIGDATKNGIGKIGGAKPNRGIDNIASRG